MLRPRDLTFLYMKLFYLPFLGFVEGNKKILGILSFHLTLSRSELPSTPLYGSRVSFLPSQVYFSSPVIQLAPSAFMEIAPYDGISLLAGLMSQNTDLP